MALNEFLVLSSECKNNIRMKIIVLYVTYFLLLNFFFNHENLEPVQKAIYSTLLLKSQLFNSMCVNLILLSVNSKSVQKKPGAFKIWDY